jgi:acyl-CoA reductase-like NAD-dependent aldehyde dehydrogenase
MCRRALLLDPTNDLELNLQHFFDRASQSRFLQTIAGEAVASSFAPVIDPSTGAPFQQYPVASTAELDSAVAAARSAQPAWNALGWDAREQLLVQFADGIDAELDWISALHTMEQGMPFALSQVFVKATAQRIRTMAAFRVDDRVLSDDAARHASQRWHPLGVVAAIAPWNGPLMLGMIKVVTALIGGNTMVLKPSELTPLSTLELGRISRSILPPGVLNVVTGGGAVGAAMVTHPGFDKVSFTGSTATGIAIARESAQFLRPVTLELGGNDAAILLPDGSIDDLVAAASGTGFGNCGQFCAAVKRVYAPAHMIGEVCEKLTAAANAYRLGAGFEDGVTLGPIQNKAQFDKVCAIVDSARADGGRILTGGAPLDRDGYFYPPTVIAGLTDGARLVDEEQFGPVIPVVVYDNVDDVIAAINAGPYGLTASIWTRDLARGTAIAERLAVGSAAINRHAAFDPHLPFPLIKQSGVGIDYADHGIKGTMRLQVISAFPA